MRRPFAVAWCVAAQVSLILAGTVPAAAQAPAAAGRTPKRAPSVATAAAGHPSLEGIWSSATLTPFERPRELAGKEFYTPEEAAAFEKRTLEASNRDRRAATPEADVNQAYNEAWFERGTTLFPTRRTSIVIDPPDGRVPPLTPEAQRAAAARAQPPEAAPAGPEDLSLPVRCILWPTAGPPMIPGPYNNNYQIVQTGDHLAIYIEMIHDMRIIPLDGRPHISGRIRQWMGDPVGRWEGDTLVVDTTNFTAKTHYRGSDENLHLVERFTRTGANTIRYRFTVDDPTAFTRPWTGEITLVRTKGPLYEYACHEANYALGNMLRAARVAEKPGAGK